MFWCCVNLIYPCRFNDQTEGINGYGTARVAILSNLGVKRNPISVDKRRPFYVNEESFHNNERKEHSTEIRSTETPASDRINLIFKLEKKIHLKNYIFFFKS